MRIGSMIKAVVTVVALTTTAPLGAQAAQPAPDSGIGVQSWAPAHTLVSGVNLRYGPSIGSGWGGQLGGSGTPLRVVCQVWGQNVNGASGWSALWDYVVAQDGSGKEGFAADTNIYTGHPGWIPGVETCVV